MDRYGGTTLLKFREALDNNKLEDLVVLQSHQPVPDITLAKKYEDLLAAHEDVTNKLIAKEDFRQKLVNAEERMKSLEVNNSEWIVLFITWFEVIVVEFSDYQLHIVEFDNIGGLALNIKEGNRK
ncbi:hypothetical protein GIB67_017521 [Kingdonia uniflora]|uniref:Uncharacterized protein n=1 Tax=Kingdonia uniflora TaxID=39325 RepID=A0A7J7M4T5_9MAGN|nr:hypothetical protein GIB67_017521 [Kingdonia uniflora]